MDAQLLVRDLGQGRLHPLAVRMDTDQQDQRAIRIDPRRRAFVTGNDRRAAPGPFRRAMRRLFGVARQADTPDPAVGRRSALLGANVVVPHQIRGTAHAFRIVTIVELHAADRLIGHLVGRHHVGHAHVQRVAANGAGDRVDGAFDGETGAGPGNAAIDAQGRLVGRHRPGAAAHMLDPIGARQVSRRHAGFHERARVPQRVGAGIDGQFRIDALDDPVTVGIGCDPVDMLARLGRGHQVFAPVFEPADWLAGIERDGADDDLLRHQPRLAAEPAADVGGNDAQLVGRQVQHLRQTGAHQMRNLRRQIDNQLLRPRVPMGQYRPGFQRSDGLPVHSVIPRDHDWRVAHAVDVAAGNVQLNVDIVAPFLMQQGGRVFARCHGVMQGGQFLDIRGQRIGQILRFGPVGSQAGGDAFAGEADLVRGERMMVSGFEARHRRFDSDRIDARQVGRGVDPIIHTFGYLDPAQPAMRVGAAQEGDVQGSRDIDVGDVHSLAAQKPLVLLARQGGADPEPFIFGIGHSIAHVPSGSTCAHFSRMRSSSSRLERATMGNSSIRFQGRHASMTRRELRLSVSPS